MSCALKNSKCVHNNTDTCHNCRYETGYTVPQIRPKLYELYCPVCPLGYADCVCDPAYVQWSDLEWYKELYGDLTPEEVAKKECYQYIVNSTFCSCYDDEDK